jgi:hypothetical protein
MATTAILELQLKTSQLDDRLKKTERGLGRVQSRALNLGHVFRVVLAGAAAKAGWSMIKMASDAEETGTKFEAVFKGIEKESEIVAKAFAKNFGLATSTSKELLSNTGDLLNGFGFTRGEALNLSNEVNKLAVDLASFKNFAGGATGASQALTKALLGETESAKSLGIVIRQGSKEFKENVKTTMALTGATENQAKAQEIWNQILAQTKDAQGDYNRTQDGTANRIRKLDETWKSFQETLGKFLTEGLEVNKILEAMNKAVKFLIDNANTAKAAFKTFFVDYIAFSSRMQNDVGRVFNKAVTDAKRLGASLLGVEGAEEFYKKQLEKENRIRNFIRDEATRKQIAANEKIFQEWKKTEDKKKVITKKNVDDALKDAIAKTKELSLAEQLGITDVKSMKDILGEIDLLGDITGDADSETQQRRGNQFAGAVEKGSREAYSIEKQDVGNKTERKQLKVQEKIERNTRGQSETNKITIAG